MKTKQKKHSFFTTLPIFIFGFVLGFLFLMTRQANAKVTLEATPTVLYAGVPFQIPIVISTTESINALEGEIIVPAGITVSGIEEGSSVISFWVEKPELKNNTIRFAGIAPGGVTGTNLLLFTLRGVAQKEGVFSFLATSLSALANDGKGSAVPILYTKKLLQVLPLGPNTKIPIIEKDTTPPAPFFIQISNDETLYNGKPFAIFETSDKESGISHYEIASSFWPVIKNIKKEANLSWQEAKSPLMLLKSFWPKYVYIRAIDLDGNIQTAVLSPQKGDFKYLGFFVFVMMLLILLGRVLRTRFFCL